MELGYSTKAKATRIIDGDTIEVTITRKLNIRLRDIDVYERRTEKGIEATKFVSDLILNKDVVLFVPTNDSEKLMDINSFNRIVGDIYVLNNDGLISYNISDLLRADGFEKRK